MGAYSRRLAKLRQTFRSDMVLDFLKRQNPWVISVIVALILVGGYRTLFAAPENFPTESIVVIARGTSAPLAAQELYNMHIIAHSSILQFILRISGQSTSVQAGAYRFETPQNVFTVAKRLATGAYGFPPVRVTFPEGITVREVAKKVAEALPGIKASDFVNEAQQYEGYLFPDTYLFPPSADSASVIASMRANFNTRIGLFSSDIQASGHSLSDIVIMASLIEKEVRTTTNRRIVSGILWNRLKLGMLLQVDAVFGYIFNRDTYSPSFSDLKTESPYNLYLHRGLPPGPINNPGLDSLDTAINPTATDYLYYLTDKNGGIHYAKTYADHQANQQKYLR